MTFLSLVAVASSLLVVTAPNTVISVLWLVLVFVITGLLLGLTGLGYAALLYVIVYVGAIAIIFLFVIQLLGTKTNLSRLNNWARLLPVVSSPVGNDMPAQAIGTSAGQSNGATGSELLPVATIICLTILFILSSPSYWPGLGTDVFTASIACADNVRSFSSMDLWLFTLARPFYFSGSSDLQEPLAYDLIGGGQLNSEISQSFNISDRCYASQVYNLAEWLYGGATLPLVIASIILLLAMIAPIVLCRVKEV